MVFTECTCSTTRCGSTECMAVSTEVRNGFPQSREHWPAGSASRCTHLLVSARSTGTRISSCPACASHLPEALIQRTPSILTEVLPVPACTSNGSLPNRADNSSKGGIAESAVVNKGSSRTSIGTYLTELFK